MHASVSDHHSSRVLTDVCLFVCLFVCRWLLTGLVYTKTIIHLSVGVSYSASCVLVLSNDYSLVTSLMRNEVRTSARDTRAHLVFSQLPAC